MRQFRQDREQEQRGQPGRSGTAARREPLQPGKAEACRGLAIRIPLNPTQTVGQPGNDAGITARTVQAEEQKAKTYILLGVVTAPVASCACASESQQQGRRDVSRAGSDNIRQRTRVRRRAKEDKGTRQRATYHSHVQARQHRQRGSSRARTGYWKVARGWSRPDAYTSTCPNQRTTKAVSGRLAQRTKQTISQGISRRTRAAAAGRHASAKRQIA